MNLEKHRVVDGLSFTAGALIVVAWAIAVGKWATLEEPRREPVCGPVLDLSPEVHGYREVCTPP